MQPKSLSLLAAHLHIASTALLPPTRNALTLPPLPQNHTSSTIFERIDYLVPQTTTFISALLHTTHALPAMEVEIVLSAIEQQLTNHISTHGDGPLSVADDPYEYGLPGCYCSTSSASDDSLSYGVLRDTMRGLQHVMVGGGRFFVAFYDISEGGAGGRSLGEGNVESKGPEVVKGLR